MANKLYDEAAVQAIANAIRTRSGIYNTYKISEMASAITNIPTATLVAGTFTANGSYQPQSGTDGYSSVTISIPTYDGSVS